jgi:hypothetical protein
MSEWINLNEGVWAMRMMMIVGRHTFYTIHKQEYGSNSAQTIGRVVT